MYYIRKLSKLSTLTKIRSVENIEDIPADLLKQELPTKDNKLSFWKCDSIDDTKDAMKAILLATTKIEKSQFIILNEGMLDKIGVKRDCSQKGDTGYSGFENLHVDFCELTYGKIGQILRLMKEAGKKGELVPILEKDEVKAFIREVSKAGLLNTDQVNKDLLNDITKYKLNET